MNKQKLFLSQLIVGLSVLAGCQPTPSAQEKKESMPAAAGILFYRYTPDDGIDVLLSKHTNGIWSDLGGYLDTGESPEDGAVREAVEESGFMFDELNDLSIYPMIRNFKKSESYKLLKGLFVHTPQYVSSPRYRMYLIAWPEKYSIEKFKRNQFLLRQAGAPAVFREKRAIDWVPLKKVKEAVSKSTYKPKVRLEGKSLPVRKKMAPTLLKAIELLERN